MNIIRSQGRLAGAVVILSLLIVIAFTFPMSIFATEQAGTQDSDGNDYSAVFQKNDGTEATRHKDSDKVRVIIELKDEPLLEQPAMKSYSSTDKYLSSNTAQKKQKSILQAQKKVTRKLNTSDMEVKVRHQYTAVINGIGAEVKYGDIEEIESLSEVEGVYLAEKYASIEPSLTESTETIGSTTLNETGYTGKGTATAILDTGLDVDHEAFSGEVDNPKYSKEDIASAIANNSLTIGKLDSSTVYHNSKIPYAFDYAGNDYNVDGGHSHGTHVAGIVGANAGGTVTGVAPDTQFFIMKVFDDAAEGAYDDDILAALDDSVKLGVENINMSLGSDSGFSVDSDKKMKEVYERVEAAGINLMCAAGNAYSASYDGDSTNDLPLATNPDNSTVSSPSTYSAATSVASVNNNESTDPYFMVNGEKVRYLDSGDSGDELFETLSGTYEYVNCGYGATADFKNVNVKNKIALIQRGGEENGSPIYFSTKEENARNAGAIAVIIYDNVEGDLVSMSTDHKVPTVFINKEDGEKMAKSSPGTIVADPDYIGKFNSEYSGRMSDFSSWGVTPDLQLKPEITAPGGNIYSTLMDGKYGNMSGTSMASPHMAGAAAIMEQYANEELEGTDMTQTQRKNLVNALMMSTASKVKDEDGNIASPRKQGAGLVQLQNAVKAGAYLTKDTQGGKPIISMGDSTSGTFDFNFYLNRLNSDNISNYQISVTVMTEKTKTKNGKTYMAQKDRVLTSDEVTVTTQETVKARKSAQNVNVKIALTEEGKKNLSKDFPNGIYVEGYVTLTPITGEETTELSLPFMGFYGDWSSASMFDATLYDDEEPALTAMYLAQFDNYSGSGYALGHNLYGDASIYDKNKIAIQGGDSSTNVTAVCTLLRNASKLVFSVENSEGEEVYSESSENISKSTYSSEGYYQPTAVTGWIQKESYAEDVLPDGNYTYKVKGYLAAAGEDDAAQEVTFPITIDSEKPEIVKTQIKGNKWYVTVKDNHYVQAVGVSLDGTSAPVTGWVNPDEKEAGAETTVVFDLSDSGFKGATQAKIAMVDYADNQVVSDYYDISKGTTVKLPKGMNFYRTSSNDSDWSKASQYDKNNDGIIDVEDLVLEMASGE